jgi:hypothetical protein
MADNFSEPSTATKKSSSSKQFVYSSYEGDDVFSPYDGEVYSVDDRDCTGNVKIRHNYNGETLFSNFCGVGRSNVLSGQKVYKGKTIGSFGKENLSFSIIDKRGTKQNIPTLIKGVETKKEDPKKEKNIEPKKTSYGSSSETLGQDLLKSLLLLPAYGLEKLGKTAKIQKKEKPKDEESEKPNDIVFEEIKRIKNLMK